MFKQQHCVIALAFLVFITSSTFVYADSERRPIMKEEQDYYMSVILPLKKTVKNAMPPVPAGWKVAGEEKIEETAPKSVSIGGLKGLYFIYYIIYKRESADGDRIKLQNAYTEIYKKNMAETKSLRDTFNKKLNETSKSLVDAIKRKDKKEIDRLNKENVEIGKQIGAINAEFEKKATEEMEKYLVKDAEAKIRVIVNAEGAGLYKGESFTVSGATFAQQTKGERDGVTEWKEGKTLVLLGNWYKIEGGYKLDIKRLPFLQKAQSIMIEITADRERTKQLLRQMDMNVLNALIK